MNRLENALQQARILDGLRHPVVHPCSARAVSQRAFGIHEFTASHWVNFFVAQLLVLCLFTFCVQQY
jgi:hypothetical protein